MNISGLIAGHARYRPEHVAFVFDDKRFAYREFNQRVAAKFQQVQKVVFVEDFPRSVAGKTLKRVLREPHWTKRDTRI